MNDLKFAFRQLLKNPGFAAVAVLTLALGIGATTTVFSIVDGVVLKPLHYEQPGQLVQVWEAAAPANATRFRRAHSSTGGGTAPCSKTCPSGARPI